MADKEKGSRSSSRSRFVEGDLLSNFEQLEKLFAVLNKNEIADFRWEDESGKLVVKTKFSGSDGPSMVWQPAALSGFTSGAGGGFHSAGHGPNPTATSSEEAKGTHKKVLSPFVGTFYRAPSPASEPYVREGKLVKPGDILCIVEAMKLMNEIESEFSGKIVTVLVENGQPVEFGEPLFVIEPSA